MPRAPAVSLALALAALELAACGRQSGGSGRADTVAFDPYHLPPSDTLPPALYDGWKHYRLLCDRCHGEDARGTTFGPDLLVALRPTGRVPTEATFVALLLTGRPDKGMPAAARLGLPPEQFHGVYEYLKGRSTGAFAGGRPARRPE